MKVNEFEDAVWAVDGIRVVLRANPETVVKSYDKKNAADAGWRITEFISKRISPCIGDIAVVVIQGDGEEPNGNVILRTLRKGYAS